MFRNLLAEMKRKGVTNIDIAKELRVDERTVRNYLSGKTNIAWCDVLRIHRRFFPEYELAYLFNFEDQQVS